MEMHPRERRDAREPKGAAVASGRRGSSGRAVKRQEQGREQQDYNRSQINKYTTVIVYNNELENEFHPI